MGPLIIVIVIIVVLALIVAGLYNGLVQRRNRVDEALGQIQVQLKRRWDLIPNLINAVKGYMAYEQQVLTQVTDARSSAIAAGAQGPAASAAAENALTQSLRSLFAVVENYPDLKANQNVLSLQEELTTTENQISFSRQHYNATVLDYNNTIQTVPSAFIAGPFGFTKREFFEAEQQAQQVPTVDLGFGTPTTQPGQAAPPVPPMAPPPVAPPPSVPPASEPGPGPQTPPPAPQG
ncbi:MAG TPA: LemA family protein [Candidatus Limnocylindrales bacterium]|nr:LemA family protein [Candidatus Limnocylindrales bacterium]